MSQSIQQAIYNERMRLLYENSIASTGVVLTATLILTAIMWGEVPTTLVVGWSAYNILAAFIRIGLVMHFKRAQASATPQQWVARYAVITSAVGLGWMFYVLIGYGETPFQNLVALVVALGFTSLAVPVLMPFPRILIVYVTPAVSAAIFMLVASLEIDRILLATGFVAYLLLILRTAVMLYRSLITSLQTRFEKQALAEKLDAQQQQTEHLNQQLRLEINERQAAQHKLEAHQENLEKQVRERTEELLLAKEAAEAGNRAKGEFLANISHEIRTPMNGVLGVTQLLQRTALNDQQRRYVEVAHESATTLLRLIDDILDFSMIESGQLRLTSETFEPSKLIADAMRTIQPLAKQKQLKVQVQLAPNLPHKLVGAQLRIRQVLLNLLSNAIKFTEQGGIRISVRESAREQHKVQIAFEVADSGIGISKDACEHIFHAFTQEDGSITRRFGGTGLGLSISRGLVDAMGGSIEVESEPDQGSTFRFVLPLEIAQSDDPSSARVAEHTQELPTFSGHVLVAEDNQVNQIIAQDALELLGFQVSLAQNGREALELRRQGSFDWILMDYHMPELNGLQATQQIRAEEQQNAWPAIPIVALTADAQEQTRRRCEQAGMDGFLVKPFGLHALAEAVAAIGITPNT